MQRGFREEFDVIFVTPRKEKSKHILKSQKPNEEPTLESVIVFQRGPSGGGK